MDSILKKLTCLHKRGDQNQHFDHHGEYNISNYKVEL
jgi:hypothetical protein